MYPNQFFIISLGILLISLEAFRPFVSAQKKYKDACTQDSECETGFCHRSKAACECPSFADKSKRTSDQFYDYDLKMCLSRVEQLCTLNQQNDRLISFTCIPNADCISSRYQSLSREFFGYCTCKSGYEPSENGKRCDTKLQVGKVVSLDQVRPEGWNKSGGNPAFIKITSLRESGLLIFISIIVSTRLGLFPFR